MTAIPDTPAAVDLRDVRKIYGTGPDPVAALDGVNLRIDPGEFVAITGTSGSGKSRLHGEQHSCGPWHIVFCPCGLQHRHCNTIGHERCSGLRQPVEADQRQSTRAGR